MVAYRDDLEASFQRASALEDALERSDADRAELASERDRLAAELAKAREMRAPAPAPPAPSPIVVTQMVVAERAPLTSREVATLVDDLDTLAADTRARVTLGPTLGLVATGLIGVIELANASFALAGVCGVTGIVLGLLTISPQGNELVVRTNDWLPLFEQLRRRCPSAMFDA